VNSIRFIKTELAAALARGVRQCVIVGSRPLLREAVKSTQDQTLQVFTVDDGQPAVLAAIFIPAQFPSETLAATLERSDFDKGKASLFIWLGGARYRTVDAVIAGLAFIASMPQGSAVLFDYAVEWTSFRAVTHSALGALASRVLSAGSVRYLIQPQAVAAMLRGLGFRQIVDLAPGELAISGGHLVSAVI
jgi:O-methyltransferase involved in polyketide biosynthesis